MSAWVVDVRGVSSLQWVELDPLEPLESLRAERVAGVVVRPPAWGALAGALVERRALSVVYHDHERVVCPHVLGWKDSRARVLALQVAGATSTGALCGSVQRHWRHMFVDEIEDAVLSEARWATASNYRADPARSGMDVVELQLSAAQVGSKAGEGSCG